MSKTLGIWQLSIANMGSRDRCASNHSRIAVEMLAYQNCSQGKQVLRCVLDRCAHNAT